MEKKLTPITPAPPAPPRPSPNLDSCDDGPIIKVITRVEKTEIRGVVRVVKEILFLGYVVFHRERLAEPGLMGGFDYLD